MFRRLHTPARTAQKGFTLVELAIVMTIVGLLIGGILKGQELIENARILSAGAYMRAVQAGAIGFQDAYGFPPGDVPTPTRKIPGCEAGSGCDTLANMGGDYDEQRGDRMVGWAYWSYGSISYSPGVDPAPTFPGQGFVIGNAITQGEATAFWAQLGLAGFLGGIDTRSFAEIISGSCAHLAGNMPALAGCASDAINSGRGKVPFDAGVDIGYANGQVRAPGSPVTARAPIGHQILFRHRSAMMEFLTQSVTNPDVIPPLTPAQAARLDRRMDDGRPHTGAIKAWGRESCFGTNADAPQYIEANTNKACGLFFDLM